MSSLLDPNNHAPEVTPDDDWGDFDGFSESAQATGTMLPPRRGALSRPAVEKPEPSLRIEPQLARGAPDDEPHRLEVQEIGSSIVRLDSPEPAGAPARAERQVPFQPLQPRPAAVRGGPGENREWGRVQRHSLRWMIAGGAGVAVAVVAALVLLPAINAPNAARPLDPADFALAPEPVLDGLEEMNALTLRHDEAMRLFGTYARAATAADVLPFLRDGSGLRETLRDHWQPLGMAGDWAPSAASPWGIFKTGSRHYGQLTVALPDQTTVAACFVLEDGTLMLDWEATTGHSSADFAELAAGHGDPREIRGEMSAADYYTAAWPEEEYQSFRLVSPDGVTALWCYARRGTAAEAGVAGPLVGGAILQEAAKSRKMTVRLERGPDEALPNQWRVAEMLHLDWVRP